MRRIRITIEVDTALDRDIFNAMSRNLASKLNDNKIEVVYLATEIVPTQDIRQRYIIEDKT